LTDTTHDVNTTGDLILKLFSLLGSRLFPPEHRAARVARYVRRELLPGVVGEVDSNQRVVRSSWIERYHLAVVKFEAMLPFLGLQDVKVRKIRALGLLGVLRAVLRQDKLPDLLHVCSVADVGVK